MPARQRAIVRDGSDSAVSVSVREAPQDEIEGSLCRYYLIAVCSKHTRYLADVHLLFSRYTLDVHSI